MNCWKGGSPFRPPHTSFHDTPFSSDRSAETYSFFRTSKECGFELTVMLTVGFSMDKMHIGSRPDRRYVTFSLPGIGTVTMSCCQSQREYVWKNARMSWVGVAEGGRSRQMRARRKARWKPPRNPNRAPISPLSLRNSLSARWARRKWSKDGRAFFNASTSRWAFRIRSVEPGRAKTEESRGRCGKSTQLVHSMISIPFFSERSWNTTHHSMSFPAGQYCKSIFTP